VQQGTVSVKIAQVSLDEVLREITAQSRIKLVLDASRQERISADFQALSLDEALRTLIRENFLLLYGIDGRLTGVWVLPGPRQRLDSGARESFDSLILALHNGDAERRREAVWLLGEFHDEWARQAVIGALERDEDPDVRQRAAWALEDLGGYQAIAALTKVISEDRDYTVRQRAAEAVAKIGGYEAIDPLTRALKDDPEPFVRYEALVSLDEIGGDHVTASLLQALDDPEELVRAKAEEILQIQGGGGRE
jgi:HEAT repeat protein